MPGSATVPATALALVDLVQRMGKTSLVLRRDIPGFLWNRLQFAVLRACLYPLDEGVADVASIDVAVSDGLAPRWLTGGPLATADLGGLDTFRRAAAQLFPALAGPAEAPRSLARRAEEERCFYGRTDEALAAVEALRAEAIEAGRGLAERRRTAMPEADA